MVKDPPANAGDISLIPGSGKSPGEGNGRPPQNSCRGNPMDRGDLVGYSPGCRRVRRLSDSNSKLTGHKLVVFHSLWAQSPFPRGGQVPLPGASEATWAWRLSPAPSTCPALQRRP